MATDRGQHRLKAEVIERNNRPTRWFHAGAGLVVVVLLGTGWWLWAGLEGRPSPLARMTGIGDAALHTASGWVLVAVAVAGAVLGRRAVRTLVAESVRFRRSDLRWLARWPRAAFAGRFDRHDGLLDPGQRIATIVLLGLLALLVASGAGLAVVSGGPVFAVLGGVHRAATYLVTPVLAGHVLVASGILPGYRGIWRAMHLGGRLYVADARRVWPGWTERTAARR
jgi:cytochrome b subunit of formate dehydrogenase